MSDRFTSSAAALTAAVLLIVLGGAGAGAEPRAKRHHAPQPPQLDAPPRIERPWLYVHCAGSSFDEPCALDPAMRRLNGDPVPRSGPSFGPTR
ncbi:MAG TPA: hypothetical protein VK591_09995 [Xanthobacteraceae bacterium]|nr:hypothetical protein [Xanthobacteraceae bacterium]